MFGKAALPLEAAGNPGCGRGGRRGTRGECIEDCTPQIRACREWAARGGVTRRKKTAGVRPAVVIAMRNRADTLVCGAVSG